MAHRAAEAAVEIEIWLKYVARRRAVEWLVDSSSLILATECH